METVGRLSVGMAALLVAVTGGVAVAVGRPAEATTPEIGTAAAAQARPSNTARETAVRAEASVSPFVAVLDIAKSITPDPLTVGGSGVYTVMISNSGDTPAEDVTITDTLDPGVSPGALPSGCSAAGQTVTCGGAGLTVPPGSSLTVQIPITVDPSLPDGTNIINNATVSSSTAGSDATQLITQAQTLADVAITKTAPATVNQDGTITYTVTVTNNGPSDAVDVTVQDPTNGNLTTIVERPAQCPGGGLTLTCPLGTLGPGQTETFTFTVRVNPDVSDGTILNCATVYTGTRQSTTDNDQSCVDTTVTAPTPTPTPTASPTPAPTPTPTASATTNPLPSPTSTNGTGHLPVTGPPGLALGATALVLIIAGLLLRRLYST